MGGAPWAGRVLSRPRTGLRHVTPTIGAIMNIRLLFITLLLAGCAAALPQAPPVGLSARVAAPSVAAGASWTFRTYDGYTGIEGGTYRETVLEAGPQTLTTQFARDGAQPQTRRYTRDWNWLERPMTNLGNFRYDPPYPALPFPLEAGQQWRSRVRATDPATGRVNVVLIHGDVLGWERVRVPAGEFDTLKIRRIVYAGNAEFFRGEENIFEYEWYAPALGQAVKRSTSSEHLDRSQSCNGGHISLNCQRVRGDWTIAELVSVRSSAPPKAGIQ